MDGFVELTLENLKTVEGVNQLNRMMRQVFESIQNDQNGFADYSGYGTPESSITAKIGSIYKRLDGGASTTLYVKESGANTNTGWVAK